MLFAALSCLQGMRAGDAAAALLGLGVDGIQLTPGCAPDARLAAIVGETPVRTHHGYHPGALRTAVYGADGEVLVGADSVHPPRAAHAGQFFGRLESGAYGSMAFETMYPGYVLGDERALDRYLATGAPLAVDVSHLHIQLEAGVLSAAGAQRIYDYDNIAEIHVSRDEHGRDLHRVFDNGDYRIGWARERHQEGSVVVVECYLHRLPAGEWAAPFRAIDGRNVAHRDATVTPRREEP